MTVLGQAAAVEAVAAAYADVTAAVDGLGEADMMRATRCAGWSERTSSITSCYRARHRA